MSSSSSITPSSQLFEALKPNVWVIKVVGVDYLKNVSTRYFAGVCVHKSGLVLTSAHWYHLNPSELKARRVDKVNYNNFEVVNVISSWGICLIKVENVKNCPFASFGTGELSLGDSIYQIRHQGSVFGLCSRGIVSFPCVKKPIVPNEKSSETCQVYDYSTYKNETPPYRVAGHIWRVGKCNLFGVSLFEPQLLSQLPVIQCGGLVFYEGCLGGPLFDCSGKLMGIVIGKTPQVHIKFVIGTHVKVLEEFMKISV